MEQLLLNYGPLGLMVFGLSTACMYLWRELLKCHEKAAEQNIQHQQHQRAKAEAYLERYEEMLRQLLQSEIKARESLEHLAEGLNTQELLAKYMERVERRTDEAHRTASGNFRQHD